MPSPAAATSSIGGAARIRLRLHPDWSPVLLPPGVLPQVAMDVGVTPIPGCSVWFRGVLGRRGAVVPVFDVAASVGLEAAPIRKAKIVVLDPGPEALALLCAEVPGVAAVAGPASTTAAVGLPDKLAPFLDPPLICGGQALAVFDVRRWLAAHSSTIAL